MKCFICSIGQPTTEICKEQMEKFGFEVIMLDKKESWADKYKRFIETANENCIRIDADIIPNEEIKYIPIYRFDEYLMVQFMGYDFYKNNTGVIGVTYYSKIALQIIRNNMDKLDWRRPEATAWRLPEINENNKTDKNIVGIHGFFQKEQDLKRHEENKKDRKQINNYDFNLANKILKL